MLEKDHPEPTAQITGKDHSCSVADDALVLGPVVLTGRGCSLEIQSASRLTHEGSANAIEIAGENSTLVLERATTFTGFIKIQGDRSHVRVAEGCVIAGKINIRSDDCIVSIGPGTTANGISIQMHEPGSVVIGGDCMISKEVYISNSDIHPIYDRSSDRRINPARSIEIGDHVWLGLRVMVLKGAVVGNGSVIGAGSIASGSIPENCIASGAPARVVREDVRWERDFLAADLASIPVTFD